MTYLSTILSFFTPAVVILAVAMGLINLFLAGRRSWIMAIFRVVFTVGAALGALPLARLLAGALTDTVYGFIIPMLGPDIGGLLNDVPVGAEGMRVVATLIAAPVLYLSIFVLLRSFLALIGWILCKCIPALGEPSVRGVSMPLGALSGLLIVVVTLIPVCGFLAMGGRVMGEFSTCMAENESPTMDSLLANIGTDGEQIGDMAGRINEHPVIHTMDVAVASPIFDYLTVGTLDTSATHNKVIELSLEDELTGLLCASVHVMNAKDALAKEDFVAADKALLYAAADSVLESEWVTMVATDAIVLISETWMQGEDLWILACPEVDANIKPMLDRTLLILSAESVDTLAEDIHTIADVAGDFLVLDMLSGEADPTEMIKSISQSDLLTTTMTKLKANPRLAPLAHELKSMSVRLLTDMLGVESLLSGEHTDLMNNVAGELNGVLDMSEDERHEVINESLEKVFDDYGYEVPPDVANEMADHLIDELGQDGEITGDELTDYLVNHSDELGDIIPDDLPVGDLPVGDLPVGDLSTETQP